MRRLAIAVVVALSVMVLMADFASAKATSVVGTRGTSTTRVTGYTTHAAVDGVGLARYRSSTCALSDLTGHTCSELR
jgi:hypothetical protein